MCLLLLPHVSQPLAFLLAHLTALIIPVFLLSRHRLHFLKCILPCSPLCSSAAFAHSVINPPRSLSTPNSPPHSHLPSPGELPQSGLGAPPVPRCGLLYFPKLSLTTVHCNRLLTNVGLPLECQLQVAGSHYVDCFTCSALKTAWLPTSTP